MTELAAELDDNNVVIQVIVGDAQFATDNLGGVWVPINHNAGPGWLFDGTDVVPPSAPDNNDLDNDLDGLA